MIQAQQYIYNRTAEKENDKDTAVAQLQPPKILRNNEAKCNEVKKYK